MTTPYKFQAEDVDRIDQLKGRCLLANEMGTGKTLTSLLWAQQHPEARPVIVVCPASVKYNWEREASIHVQMRCKILEGKKPSLGGMISKPNLVVLNYDILKHWLPYLKELNPQLIILDEVHFCKNRKAARTRAAQALCKGVPHVLALSGTPLTNRPAELYPALQILRQDLFPSFWSFAHEFCSPKRTFWGWDFRGATNLDVLHSRLAQNLMIRRLKKDVMRDLPPKSRFVVPVEISNRKEYHQAATDFIGWLRKQGNGSTTRAAKAERLCFPYNTTIETNFGPIPIGKIVEENANVQVKSVNLATSEIQWRSIKAYTKRKTPNQMVRVIHEAGQFSCTTNHRIWTTRGYIRAKALVPGDCLSYLQTNVQIGNKKGSTPNMFREMRGIPPLVHSQGPQRPHNRKTMQTMPQNFQTSKAYLEGQTIVASRVVRIEIYQRRSGEQPKNNPFKNSVYDIEVKQNHNFFADGVLVHNCRIAGLKRLAAKLKLPSVLNWIDSFLEESDGKIIVFAIHKSIIAQLKAKYDNLSVVVDGSVTGRKRQKAFDKFTKSKRIRVLVGNIQAAGVGWNGTAASTVLFAELDWVPGNHSQCEDRIARIGQKEPASVYYLVGVGTIEMELCKIIQQKQEVLDQTLDGKASKDSLDVFDQLSKQLLQRGE